jgi:Fe(3+) dicitrate transport protein
MPQDRYRRPALAVTGLLAAVAAYGQQAAMDNITIVGRPIDVADVPGSAHVLDAEALEIFNDTDILRALRAVPGVYLQEEEGFGLRPNIGIRGSGLDRSARIALLEDGVLIAPAPYSAPSAYYFPTQRRMNSLEVLKGPASVVVGPRTTGGALNLISTPIPDEFAANADLRVGENNSYDLHANIGNRGERVSWLVETVQGRSDGFMHVASPLDGDTGFDIEDYVAKLQIDSAPDAEIYQSLRLKVGYTDQLSEQTYLGLTDTDFATDPLLRYAATEGDVFVSEHEQVQLDYVFDPGNSWRASVTAYRNDFERNWYKLQSVNGTGLDNVLTDPDTYAAELSWLKGTTSPDDAITKRANSRSYYSQGIQAEVQWDLGFGDTEVALNAGVRLHEDEEDRFQHQDRYRMEDGLLVMTTAGAPGSQTNRVSDASAQAYFVNAEIRAGRWILTPGVRFEDVDLRRFDYSTADPGRGQGPTRVRENTVSTTIPGMGVLYRVNSDWRLLAGVHKGYNPPAPGSSADEESSLNIEAGTRYDNGALRFEGIYFVNDYDNLVGTVTESTGGGGEIGDQYDGGEVTVAGFELSAGYEWAVGQLRLPLSVEYTWTTEAEFKSAFDSDFGPWGDVEVGDELPYIPEHQLRAMTGIESERWRFNLAASYLGELRTTAGQGAMNAAQSIDSRVIWDVMASWRFTDRLSSYIKVDNLFDETYIAARRPAGVRPGLPRTGYLGLVYRL